MSLSPVDFPAFFEAVHGVEPFPWQARLLNEIVGRGAWPPVLDLPTGSGKTAALDIAVFHLALEADKGAARKAPVRIAFVVDRRIIVDDAFTRARSIAEAIAWSVLDDAGAETLLAEKPEAAAVVARVRAEPVIKRVALQLARLAECEKQPLLTRRLRGGVPREDDWARTPAQPTILCSTVDQVGSRLLFRGYGITNRMMPVHAGLLGSDCLILLDEAHLSEPFRQTLAAVAGHAIRRCEAEHPSRAVRFALLTATPSDRDETRFELDPETDLKDERLAPRLTATKPAHLSEIVGERGKTDLQQRVATLITLVSHALRELSTQNVPNPAVAVVVNRVARARAVFEALRGAHPDAKVGLVIGPARPLDRERTEVANLLEPIRTRVWKEDEDWRSRLTAPRIVIATQTIEAGADLDFDALVTEVASLDALRQRFGRLNRVGRTGFTPFATIVAHKDDVGRKTDDPVYGEAGAKTWAQLLVWGGDERCVDFGSLSMKERLAEIDDTTPLLAPAPDAPVMLPAYVDLWSQTWPVPVVDAEVSLFLHGPKASPDGVRIVWRADLDDIELEDAGRVLVLAPPGAGETLEISLSAAKAWLSGGDGKGSDVADAPEREGGGDANPKSGRPIFVWAGADGPRTGVAAPGALRPGDLIVVPASYGGCDRFGWAPHSEAIVEDLGAEVISAGRRAVRVTRALIAQALQREGESKSSESVEVEADIVFGKVKAFLVDQSVNQRDLCDAVMSVVPEYLTGRMGELEDPKVELDVYGRDEFDRPNGVLFWSRARQRIERAVPATEDDRLGSANGSGLALEQHSNDVRNMAGLFAERAGLPAEVAADVALAAWLHDAGKADPRFQTWLYGGSWLDVGVEVLAKSIGLLPNGSWDRAGLPPSWRHEALSVRIAREHPRFVTACDPELVLWLVGVHHGFGRPFFPDAAEAGAFEAPDVLEGLRAGVEPGPQSLAFEFGGFDWPQMFQRLKARYGVWELARLEAILRLADHRASEMRGGGV